MLEVIAGRTGMPFLMLVAGSPPAPGDIKCRVSCVHLGESREKNPKNFATWDPDGFKVVLNQFGQFLEYAAREYTFITLPLWLTYPRRM